MQIGHHGAQNRRMTGAPFKFARLRVLPSSSPSVNGGAGPHAANAPAGRSPTRATAATASARARDVEGGGSMSHWCGR